MTNEAQSRETISDSLKIGCVIAGIGQNSMKEHLLMSATTCDSWTNFVRQIESILSTQEKPSLHRHRWSLMHFKETVTSAGCTDTLRKSVGARAMEGQRSPNVHNVERNIMYRVGYGATHHPTKIHRKEDVKVTEEETAREPRKVESSKEEKAETMRKVKVEERKENVSTKSQNHQKNSGQVDLGNKADTASWRDDDWYTADSISQTSAAEEFQHASVGDLRLSNLGFVKDIESFQHD